MCRVELGGVGCGTGGGRACGVFMLLRRKLILGRRRGPSPIRRTAVARCWSSVCRIEDGASWWIGGGSCLCNASETYGVRHLMALVVFFINCVTFSLARVTEPPLPKGAIYQCTPCSSSTVHATEPIW